MSNRSLALALAVLAVACVKNQPGIDTDPVATHEPGETGDVTTVVLSLTNVPPDVRCAKVTITGGSTITRTFTVASGAPANLALTGLPIGNATVFLEAYNVACEMLATSIAATWVSEMPVTVLLVSGKQIALTVTLRRPAGLEVTGDFRGDPTGVLFEPAAADLGNALIGGENYGPPIYLRNRSGVEFPVVLAVTGTDVAQFGIKMHTCGVTLAPGASCQVMPQFLPLRAGRHTATLVAGVAGPVASLVGTGIDTTAVTLTPPRRSLGSVLVGAPASMVFPFNLTNGTPVTIPVAVSLTGAQAADFRIVSNGCVASLAPSASCTIMVRFAPQAAGTRTALISAGPGLPTATIDGTGVPSSAAVTLTPASADFGVVSAGTQGAAITFSVTNGTTATTLATLALGGADAAEFVLASSTCAGMLPAGASCTGTVRFAPQGTGPRVATLAVGPGGPFAALTGEGAPRATATLSPTEAAFPDTLVGSASAPVTFTVTNAAMGPVPVSAAISGAHAAEFAVAGMSTCPNPGTLNGGASCTYRVSFSPASQGTRSAVLTVGTVGAAALSGVGLLGAQLDASPPMVNFGSVAVGQASAASSFTITNRGGAPTATLRTLVSGTNASAFAILMDSCAGRTLQSQETCMVSVRFQPSVGGPAVAALEVMNGMSGVATSLTGTGTGGATATLTPATMDYGQVQAGTRSPSRFFELRNTSMVAYPATVAFTGPAAGNFSLDATSACPAMLAPGAACLLHVAFTPGGPGLHTATMIVGGGASAALSGTGYVITATLTPPSANFGTVSAGSSSGSVLFTLTNAMGPAFIPGGPQITGTNPFDFPHRNNGCGGGFLMPGASCTFEVLFAPTLGASSAIRAAVVTIGGPSGMTLSSQLSGTAVSWFSQDIGAVGLPGSATFSEINPDVITLRASGADIWGASDELRHAYRPIQGDFTATVRVASTTNSDPWAKAGLMMRNGTAANAMNAFVFVTPSVANRYRFQTRTAAGGSTSSANGGAGTLPIWLRLVRRGNTFTGYFSSDQMVWTQVGGTTTINVGATVNVGPALTSHNDMVLNTTQFTGAMISMP